MLSDIIEADKAQELQIYKLEIQGKARVKFRFKFKGPRSRRANGVNSSLSPKAREGPCPNSKAVRKKSIPSYSWRSAFLYSDLQVIGWGPRTSGRAICFTQSISSNVNLIPRTHPEYGLTEYLSTPLSIELTHKIKHHTWESIYPFTK